MTKTKLIRMMRGLGMLARGLPVVACILVAVASAAPSGVGQSAGQLTPIQREIERQRQRLSSSDIEERRDALIRLGNMKRPDASRAASASLNDVAVQVRVAAAHAVVFLPPAEAAGLLLPLLRDRAEFIRREAAYALGETRSPSAVARLSELLAGDKEAAVRGAAAVALGQIGDETAVNALSKALSGMKKKKAAPADEFLMRSAAHSLGQIRSRAGLPALIAALSADQNPLDVRREAAAALGVIGDAAAAPSLRAVLDSSDPYLAEAARQALRRLANARN
ncbi:MAG TPA: HEAT repeat domain-containing protein [Pyrinomonadaceae bacterium]|nr:HEAT repeat domain-containing protein [Pyrinomonadaceae bacterium]